MYICQKINMKTIYVLSCPLENKVKYIGITKGKLSDRLIQHLRAKDNGLKAYWIKKLKYYGLIPTITELIIVEDKQAGEMEKVFIQHYEDKGFYLFNINNR